MFGMPMRKVMHAGFLLAGRKYKIMAAFWADKMACCIMLGSTLLFRTVLWGGDNAWFRRMMESARIAPVKKVASVYATTFYWKILACYHWDGSAGRFGVEGVINTYKEGREPGDFGNLFWCLYLAVAHWGMISSGWYTCCLLKSVEFISTTFSSI